VLAAVMSLVIIQSMMFGLYRLQTIEGKGALVLFGLLTFFHLNFSNKYGTLLRSYQKELQGKIKQLKK
jgi:hypothetical protein